MSGLLRHIERWLTASAAVTDDDTEIWSDMRYMDELIESLLDLASITSNSVACRQIETILARPVIDDQDAYDDALGWPWYADAAGDALRAWRIHLNAHRDWAAWWLAELRREAAVAS